MQGRPDRCEIRLVDRKHVRCQVKVSCQKGVEAQVNAAFGVEVARPPPRLLAVFASPPPPPTRLTFAPFSRPRKRFDVLLYHTSPFEGVEGSPASDPKESPGVVPEGLKVCLTPSAQRLTAANSGTLLESLASGSVPVDSSLASIVFV